MRKVCGFNRWGVAMLMDGKYDDISRFDQIRSGQTTLRRMRSTMYWNFVLAGLMLSAESIQSVRRHSFDMYNWVLPIIALISSVVCMARYRRAKADHAA